MQKINKVVGGILIVLTACVNNGKKDQCKDSLLSESLKFAISSNTLLNINTSNGGFANVMNSGFGSAIAIQKNGNCLTFYLLTDRGPNYKDSLMRRIIIDPSYVPRIGIFELRDSSLVKKEEILLKDKFGQFFTGLPALSIEQAININGKPLPFDSTKSSIDSEGLVVMKDRSFWVADEYGPGLFHFDNRGKELERILPGDKNMPQVLSNRVPNRGFEGLTISQDGNTLIAAMQGPIKNRRDTLRTNDKMTRILFYDLHNRTSKQFAYMLDSVNTGISEIHALSNTEFLVLERDALYLNDKYASSKTKRIYHIDVSNASDINGVDPLSKLGCLSGGKTMEELSEVEFLRLFSPVQKNPYPIVDLLTKGYVHDKSEGIAVLDNSWLIVSNDDDFGVADSAGFLREKTLLDNTGNRVADMNTIYFFRIGENMNRKRP